MLDDELVKYVEKHVRKGIESKRIKEVLLKAGHNVNKADEAIAHVNHVHHIEKIVAMLAFLVIIIAIIALNPYFEETSAEKADGTVVVPVKGPVAQVTVTEPVNSAELVDGLLITGARKNVNLITDVIDLSNSKAIKIEFYDKKLSFSKLVISAKSEYEIITSNVPVEWKEVSKEEYVQFVQNDPIRSKRENLDEYIRQIWESKEDTFLVPVGSQTIDMKIWPLIEVSGIGKSTITLSIDSEEYKEFPINRINVDDAIKIVLPPYSKLKNVYIDKIMLI